MKTATAKSHWRALRLSSGVTIEISRGSTTRIVDAVPGSYQFEQTTYDGAQGVWTSSDWILPDDDYWFDRPDDKPQAGDTIKYNGATYEVASPPNTPVWSYLGEAQEWRLLRVHTIEVDRCG